MCISSGWDVGQSAKGSIHTSSVSLRLDIFEKIGLHKGEPLLDTAFDIATALTDIAHDCGTDQTSRLQQG